MGWRVTAVDISVTALARAQVAVKAAEVDSRVNFEQHDLSLSFPTGEFDLVSAQYFHSPIDFPRAAVLQRAAQAVALGGRLLIVDHGGPPPWMSPDQQHRHDFPTVLQTHQSLELMPDRWRIERLESCERDAVGPNGEQGKLLDNIILACRLA
jgi:SAM-dependent methyltransferase